MFDKNTWSTIQFLNKFARQQYEINKAVQAVHVVSPLPLATIQEMQRLAQESQLVINAFTPSDLHVFRAAKEMSDAYIRLTNELTLVAPILPSLAAQSAIVQIQQTRIIETLFPEQKTAESVLDEVTQQLFEATIEDIARDTRSGIDQWLTLLHPSLSEMWQGAKHTFASNGPDRPRQIMISLRALLEHLTKILAPDDEVRAWSQDPEFYQGKKINNPPSGNGRLSYICRYINHGAFSDFLKADIQFSVRLWQYLNRIHALENPLSEMELQVILERFEATLSLLMHASQAERS